MTRCTAAAFVFLAAPITPDTKAQPLDLSGPRTPAPGEGDALLAIAARLREAAAKPGVSPPSASLGNLAASLIASGESQGPDGSANVVLGLKLAHRLAAIDGLLTTSAAPIVDEVRAQADRLSAGPPDQDALSLGMRDLLAPLIDAAAPQPLESPDMPPGWGVPPAQVPWDAALASMTTLSPQDRARLNTLRTRLSLAASSAAYAPSAAAWSVRVSAVLDLLSAPPAFVTGPARAGFDSAALAAMLTLADHPSSDKAALELARLTELAGLARALESPTSAGEAGLAIGSGLARAQQALNKALATASMPATTSDSDPAKERARVASLARAASLIPVRRRLAVPSDLVRQLKPAMRTLNELAKLSENELAETLPDALSHPDAGTLPKLVAAQAEHRRRLDDLALLRELDSKLGEHAQGQPTRTVAKEFLPVAERALSFSKDVLELAAKTDPQSRLELLDAMARWRRLASRASDVARLPGEDDLRQAGSPLASLLTGHRDALISAIDSDRSAWIKAWAAPDRMPAQTVSDRLERVRQALAIAQDAAAAMGTTPPDANRLPCWEIDTATRTAAAEDLERTIRSLVQAASGPARNDSAASAVLASHGLALLIGRLERYASATLVPAQKGAWHTAAELTAGAMPAETPLAARADDLRLICRYAPQWAAADRAGRDALMRYLGPAINRCLTEIEIPAPGPP